MVQLQIYHKKLNAPTNSALKHTRCVQEQYLKDYIYLFILEISLKKNINGTINSLKQEWYNTFVASLYKYS